MESANTVRPVAGPCVAVLIVKVPEDLVSSEGRVDRI